MNRQPASSIDSLFDQTKNLVIRGARLSGEPEILHEIEDYYRKYEFFPIVRDQIRAILELVPATFPEGWRSPRAYADLNDVERRAHTDIARKGIVEIPGPVIQRVIELGIDYRGRYAKQGGA
jgi:hypothetical protein